MTYKTKQKEQITEYLKSRAGEHVTVADVCKYFDEHGRAVGMTTVYRQLEKMVDDGLVNKYTIDANSPACFEYMDPADHQSNSTCFHCRCDICGKLIHMQCHELEELGEHLYKKHGFTLNPRRTVLYGICEECAFKDRRMCRSGE